MAREPVSRSFFYVVLTGLAVLVAISFVGRTRDWDPTRRAVLALGYAAILAAVVMGERWSRRRPRR